ncbi:ABC transporter permease [Psychromonas sp. psych-6C06]|uniref:iron chelate uptake ABC transporter family permease subunit n=1 Tax=Psychromonas sp. psych-6C06 TaxID=2058089 RepID=UPI000C32DB48|nr:iron chelate uptake ABC transporter family permease subunit [Psychromonas sp. psych-6C06]PKF61566.1 ABC transporter permease [Psychromonas sp. psych-6C06]
MTDKQKIILLCAISLSFLVLLLGTGLTLDNYAFFLSLRIPKVIAIVLAAVAIALSSLAFQTITSNRILTPSVMGFDALYLLTQVLIVFVVGSVSVLYINPYINFIVCALTMVLFSLALFHFYFRAGNHNLLVLLLLGIILGQVFSNLTSMLAMMLSPNDFASLQANMFASFNHVKVELIYICAPVITFAAYSLFKMHQTLNVLWLNHDNATSLGVNVLATNRKVLLLSTLLIAVSTALVGPILFFGFLVTNLTREWIQSYHHRTLFIACVLIATCTLLIGQFFIEHLFELQTTLSVVINFIGGVYFLRILLKKQIL